MKTKINVNSATDMRIKETFDFLQVHQHDLSDSQIEFVKSLKKQFKTRGLTGKQTQCLFDIKKSLSPSSPPIVRTNH